jgi:plastocyanin domain-containing protein
MSRLFGIVPLLLLSALACGPKSAAGAEAKSVHGEIALKVTEQGFEPADFTVKKGEPLKLVITRVTDATCAKEIVVDEYGVRAELPLDKPVVVSFTPTKAGTLRYGCGMDKMVSGVLTVQ